MDKKEKEIIMLPLLSHSLKRLETLAETRGTLADIYTSYYDFLKVLGTSRICGVRESILEQYSKRAELAYDRFISRS